MRKPKSKAEEIWDHNRAVAWILVLIGMGFVLFTTYFPQSPGFSIGLLACAAGIMSVRPEMHLYEKIAWVTILISFTFLEVRAINTTDSENLATLMNQNSQFKQTQTALFWAYDLDRQGFGQTMSEFSRVNEAEQKRFEALAKRDDALFNHEEKLAESFSGKIVAGSAPTPPNACGTNIPEGTVVVAIGTSAFKVTVFPHTVLVINGRPALELVRLNQDVIAPVLDVRGQDGRIVARFDEDGYVVGNHLAVKRPDSSTLSVIDEFGKEAINIKYPNKHIIVIKGSMNYNGKEVNLSRIGLSNICLINRGNGPDLYENVTSEK